MHKLIEYVCDELKELEDKAGREHQLSASEIEYADKLAHLKKNLLKGEEMSDYSMRGSYRDYSRDDYSGRRDSMGRYSRDNSYDGSYESSRRSMGYSRGNNVSDGLRELMSNAPAEMQGDIKRLIQKFDNM